MKRAVTLAILGLLLAPGGAARASFPTGLYVLVEKVEFGPKGAAVPEWVLIQGVFMNLYFPGTSEIRQPG